MASRTPNEVFITMHPPMTLSLEPFKLISKAGLRRILTETLGISPSPGRLTVIAFLAFLSASVRTRKFF
jgi:hypothetical protein